MVKRHKDGVDTATTNLLEANKLKQEAATLGLMQEFTRLDSTIHQFEDQAMISKSSLSTVGDGLQCFDENPHTEDLALPIFSRHDDNELDYYSLERKCVSETADSWSAISYLWQARDSV